MNSMTTRNLLGPALTAGLLLTAPLLAGDPPYRWVQLPVLNDGGMSVRALNDAGQITGYSGPQSDPPGNHMFRFVDGLPIEDLDTGQFEETFGIFINDRGQVAGYGCIFRDEFCDSFPMRHTPGMELELIGPIPDHDGNVAGINNFGDVIGYWSSLIGGPTLPFVYSDENGLVELPRISVSGAVPHDINDAGLIVGSSYTTFPATEHPVVWENGQIRDLGGFGSGRGGAHAVNESGVIVGRSETDPSRFHAFMYTEADGMMDIHPEALAISSWASDVNEAGMVLIGFDRSDVSRGIGVYVPGEGFYEIDLGPDLAGVSAPAMNERGEVVGFAVTNEWETLTFIWSRETGTVFLNEIMNGHMPDPEAAPVAINSLGQIVVQFWDGDQRASLLLTPNDIHTLTVGALVAGQEAMFDVSLATPNTIQYLVYSLSGSGRTEIPALGVTLNLDQPRLGASARADDQGRAEWRLFVPNAIRGRTVWLQVAEAGQVTPVVARTVE